MPEPKKMVNTPKVIGRVLADLFVIGLMLWAAWETDGLLRWLLLLWVAFVVLVHLSLTAIKNVSDEEASL